MLARSSRGIWTICSCTPTPRAFLFGVRSTASRSKDPNTVSGKKLSSTEWLRRQLKDPFVKQAKAQGYASRSAFKLSAIDDQHRFLRRGSTVVDLGAAPGGWSKVALDRIFHQPNGPLGGGSHLLISVDLLDMTELAGSTFLKMDFTSPSTVAKIKERLGLRKADVVLSDMSPSTSGHRSVDHLRIMSLAEAALEFAKTVLAPGGVFLVKIFSGAEETVFRRTLQDLFSTVKFMKPDASRKDSSEIFLLATGFGKKPASK